MPHTKPESSALESTPLQSSTPQSTPRKRQKSQNLACKQSQHATHSVIASTTSKTATHTTPLTSTTPIANATPPARKTPAVRILRSQFLTSASKLSIAPPPAASEIVMLGRSNVGKSSFINLLLESKIAKSSATPGKTRLINFFSTIWQCDEMTIPITLIDLPGIGYAKVSKAEQELWQRNLWEFLCKRSSIKLFIHLIDARHRDLAIDTHLADSIRTILRGDQALLPIYTKADKLTKNELSAMRRQAALICTNDTATAHKLYHAMKLDSIPRLESTQNTQPTQPTHIAESSLPHNLLDMIRLRIVLALLGQS